MASACRDCHNAACRKEATTQNFKRPTAIPTIPSIPEKPLIEQLQEQRSERVQVGRLKDQLKAALDELAKCKVDLATALGVNAAYADNAQAPGIEPRERGTVLREATWVALASDWHVEERVEPGIVNGVNEYDMNIARARVGRYFSGLNYLAAYHQDHFLIRDGVLWLGGDLITGYLREENLESNECSPVEAIAALLGWLVEGIKYILEQQPGLERLMVVCNSGNHGRLTDKVRPSTRERNSIEWLMYTMLARELATDKRVQVVLPVGAQTYLDIYDLTIRFTHGDTTKYGGGVGGILIPIYKALARWETVRRAHLTVMGHWHQYHDLSDLVINGSLIGYSAYAMEIGARYEVPRQAFFLVDKRRGKTMPSDIWVTDS